MRYLAAVLSMPNVGSASGRWSGEDRPYVHLMRVSERNKKELKEKLDVIGYYYHDFGDGWGAGITIKEVDAVEYKHLKKITRGFAGYEWMVKSILTHKRILSSSESTFFAFKDELINAGLTVEIKNEFGIYEELRSDIGLYHSLKLRCYNQRNRHAEEHMVLYLNGKHYCKLANTRESRANIITYLRSLAE